MGRTLIFIGVIMVLVGLWISYGPRIPLIGKLPGDRYSGEAGKFYVLLSVGYQHFTERGAIVGAVSDTKIRSVRNYCLAE